MPGEILAVHRRAAHRFDELLRGVGAAELHGQQIDVAENHGEDVVEVVRDAARQLADGFHLLRAKQRFARLFERFVRLLQLGDVVRDAIDADDFALGVPAHTLRDEIGLRQAAFAVRETFKLLRDTASEHLLVGLDESIGRFLVVQLEIVLADDVGPRLADEARECVVDEDVAAVEILDEDRVGRRLNHGLEQVRRVQSGHQLSVIRSVIE